MKTRINTFNNAPEMTRLFKEAWDIINIEDLKNIKLPKVERIPVELQSTIQQKMIMEALILRKQKLDKEKIDPRIDNALRLTTHGKCSAVDPRLYDDNLVDEEGTKPNACVENVVKEYFANLETRGTQMIFSDIGVPKDNKSFDIYNDIKNKLVAKGIPAKEIAFIGDYDTPELKNQMQQLMKEGKIRVLISSTDKGGTGLNVQNKMIALHHISLPWKPSDMEQREGRIIRQGNENEKVKIYTYIAQGTFDARTFEILEQKSKFIRQIMRGNSTQRKYGEECFKDESSISYDEMVEMALPNSNLKKIKELERKIKSLENQKNSFEARVRDHKKLLKEMPIKIEEAKKVRDLIVKDIEKAQQINFENDNYHIKIYGTKVGDYKEYDDKQVGTDKLYERMFQEDKNIFFRTEITKIAEYKGFEIGVNYDLTIKKFRMRMKSLETGFIYPPEELGESQIGNMTRIDNFIKRLDKSLEEQHNLKVKGLEQEEQELKKSIENAFDEKELKDLKTELKSLLEENEQNKEEISKNATKSKGLTM